MDEGNYASFGEALGGGVAGVFVDCLCFCFDFEIGCQAKCFVCILF